MRGGRRAYALLGLAVLAPFAFGTGDDVLADMVLAAAYVVMALGLNIVVGFAGLLDSATSRSTRSAPTRRRTSRRGSRTTRASRSSSAGRRPSCRASIELPARARRAAAAATLAGVLIGVPTLRLRGDYIAIVTLAFGEIIGQVAANGRDIALFGGR